MEDKQYKKFYRKTDKHLNGKIETKRDKQNNQKMKPYLVLQYLLKNSDENHTKSAYDIMGYLEECGITAERRSIKTTKWAWYVELMGLIGAGNNPMVGMTVAVSIEEAMK